MIDHEVVLELWPKLRKSLLLVVTSGWAVERGKWIRLYGIVHKNRDLVRRNGGSPFPQRPLVHARLTFRDEQVSSNLAVRKAEMLVMNDRIDDRPVIA